MISEPERVRVVVLISANAEWQAVCGKFPKATRQRSPFGEYFRISVVANGHEQPALFFHGGWGKVAAAASTQYVIDCWKPALLINLGTCGGLEGAIEAGAVLLVEKTLIYDIVEQMGDAAEAIAHYTTAIDLSWLQEPFPMNVRRGLLVSADRDLVVEEISHLKSAYEAIAGDWESGAIAHVATRNGVYCLILRGVTDVLGSGGNVTYGNFQLFEKRAAEMMEKLLSALPAWLARAGSILQRSP